MDDERIKSGSSLLTGEYFKEQLDRIWEIRLSERKFYQKITDIYARSIDYDVTAQAKTFLGHRTEQTALGHSWADGCRIDLRPG